MIWFEAVFVICPLSPERGLKIISSSVYRTDNDNNLNVKNIKKRKGIEKELKMVVELRLGL